MDQANIGGVIRKSVPGWMPMDIRPLSLSVVLVESVGPAMLAQRHERKIPGENDMSCQRCGGLMIVESCCYLMEAEFHKEIGTTRCLNCGNIEDAIIRTNRGFSCSPRPVAPSTVGSRSLNAIQSRALERATQKDDVVAKSPGGRTPRLPVGAPSVKSRRLESAYFEQPTSMIQPKGDSREYRTVVSADNLVGGRRECE